MTSVDEVYDECVGNIYSLQQQPGPNGDRCIFYLCGGGGIERGFCSNGEQIWRYVARTGMEVEFTELNYMSLVMYGDVEGEIPTMKYALCNASDENHMMLVEHLRNDAAWCLLAEHAASELELLDEDEENDEDEESNEDNDASDCPKCAQIALVLMKSHDRVKRLTELVTVMEKDIEKHENENASLRMQIKELQRKLSDEQEARMRADSERADRVAQEISMAVGQVTGDIYGDIDFMDEYSAALLIRQGAAASSAHDADLKQTVRMMVKDHMLQEVVTRELMEETELDAQVAASGIVQHAFCGPLPSEASPAMDLAKRARVEIAECRAMPNDLPQIAQIFAMQEWNPVQFLEGITVEQERAYLASMEGRRTVENAIDQTVAILPQIGNMKAELNHLNRRFNAAEAYLRSLVSSKLDGMEKGAWIGMVRLHLQERV
jgi:hypothetical protein